LFGNATRLRSAFAGTARIAPGGTAQNGIAQTFQDRAQLRVLY
jgi:hypothetical protein